MSASPGTGTPGAVLVALDAAVVVDVEGTDRLSHLEDVTTQHLVGSGPGTTSALLVLDPHGSPLAAADVVVEEARCRLVAPDAAVADHFVDVLGRRTFLADVRFSRSADRVVVLRGTSEAIGTLLASAPVAAVLGPLDASSRVVRADGIDLVLAPEAALDLVDAALAAGARAADEGDLEDARIRAGRPAWGREVRAPHLPEELGLLPTHVHLAKGCYPGQEAVARMWMLGRPRRRLVRLRALDGARLVTGATGGTASEAVEVTSATRDGAAALALAGGGTGVGARVEVDGGSAEVVAIVGEGLAVPGHDPRMRRRRDAVAGSDGATPRVNPAARGPRRP